MTKLHYAYFASFMVSSAFLNWLLEGQVPWVRLLCLILLFSTFVFASLDHSLKRSIKSKY
ncbi:hypothetical protein [Shewanella sp. SM74]|uniref:hypothetical protein n=1 Tax=Shewanella TaxID=22 RepID=UPI0021D984E8|nr:hypothetical protein [Shewanella sp. SM74]MCU8011632.1 hypothetical protein [Shewanella sp. SM74]